MDFDDRDDQAKGLAFYELDDFLRQRFPPMKFHLQPKLLPCGGSMVLFGAQKIGKTILTRQLALSLVTGEPFVGKFPVTEPADVAMLQLEIPESVWQENMARIRGAFKGYGKHKLYVASYIKGDLHVDDRLGQQTIWQTLLNLNPRPRVLILDPIFMAMAGDESNREHVKRFLSNLSMIKQALKCAVVLITHQRKPNPERPSMGMNELVGSQLWTAWADTIINVLPVNPKEQTIKLEFQTRMTAPPDTVYLRLDQKTLAFSPTTRLSRADLGQEAFLAELRVLGGVASLKEVLAAIERKGGVAHEIALEAYDKLRETGTVLAWQEGKERYVKETDAEDDFASMTQSKS